MESPFTLPAPVDKTQHGATGPMAAATSKAKASQSKASPAFKSSTDTSKSTPVREATDGSGERSSGRPVV